MNMQKIYKRSCCETDDSLLRLEDYNVGYKKVVGPAEHLNFYRPGDCF